MYYNCCHLSDSHSDILLNRTFDFVFTKMETNTNLFKRANIYVL